MFNFTVDVGNWQMAQLQDWTDSVKVADFGAVNSLLALAVTQWDVKADSGEPLPPDDPSSYRSLKPKEWKILVTATTEAMGKLFQA